MNDVVGAVRPLAGLLRQLRIPGGVDLAGSRQVELTAPASGRPLLVAAVAQQWRARRDDQRPVVLAVTATGREADELAAELGDYLDPDSVAVMPAWETLPHERLSPSSDTVGRRLQTLRRLAEDPAELAVLVVPVRAFLQPMVVGLGQQAPIVLRVEEDADLDDVVRRLVTYGYVRADVVERRGEFAVRGGILDVFPPTAEHPVRVELFGDTVAEIRYFGAADQRSMEPASHLEAPPCRELLLTPQVRERARAAVATHPTVADVLAKVAEGIAAEGMESCLALLAERLELLVDCVPADSLVLLCDPERVRARAEDMLATDTEFLEASWQATASGGAAPVDLAEGGFRSLAQVREAAAAKGLAWAATSPFAAGPDDLAGGVQSVRMGIEPTPDFHGDLAGATSAIREWVADGRTVALTSVGAGTLHRLGELLAEHDIPCAEVAHLGEARPHVVALLQARAPGGVVLPGSVDAAATCVLTERDITGRGASGETGPRSTMPSRRRNQIDLNQLRPGDHVVHEQHGVGRYLEMTQRTVAGSQREYLLVEYAPGKRGGPPDRLFVPTDQLSMLTRYVGGDEPRLDRIGGSDWARRKGRARKAVREIAGELIKLYAARQAAPGRTFGPDTPWQAELEDAFPFVETPDQLATIDEVKADMQRSIPMDRVIAGDVGYGKTEIAVRAAFKAVQDGAQVAVLVPTTLLVQQHFTTFSQRYAPFPVTVAALSRFQSDAEAAQVRQGVREGSVDVVIGTHRLISSEVAFKDLGLVIVDEEQRFGVEHKEKLKQIRANVDVLTMSATPIPRTLEMSVTGIRDMSTIATPPEERHPVLTYVGVRNDRQVAAAIRRELLREGQVFYVHNRVDTIDRAAERLRERVPEARVVVAHGQMNEHELERVIDSFWQREADVLVCTTIVETGLDIANANTLVVERADMLGLAQLHQLRGRVGRGRERAYAYFLYPPDRPLTEAAHDRLATIAAHSDLGAGMAVAMKDLEIRGAGNLLGGEQSGHIADVGFDLYVRMVGEAVEDFKRGGVPQEETPVTRVDLPVDAHLPHDYVDSERLRLEVYRRVADAPDEQTVDDIAAELQDRFGSLPQPTETLLAVARLRVAAARAGVHEVVAQGRFVRFTPVRLPDSRAVRLTRLYPGSVRKAATATLLVPRPRQRAVGGDLLSGDALLTWAAEVVSDVIAGAGPSGS